MYYVVYVRFKKQKKRKFVSTFNGCSWLAECSKQASGSLHKQKGAGNLSMCLFCPFFLLLFFVVCISTELVPINKAALLHY